MAKVRVYELARELGMDSKILVEKLKNGGVNIKNYMSTLDEESVARAKEVITGSVSEIVEEKRIKPTVIRRRRKKVKAAPEVPVSEPEETPEEGKAAIEEPKPLEEEPIQKPPSVETLEPGPAPEPPEVEQVKEPTDELEAEEAAPSVPEEEPIDETQVEDEKKSVSKAKEKPKKAKKKKGGQPAKIIKRAEEGPLKGVVEKREKEDRKARTEKSSKRGTGPLDPVDLGVPDKPEKPSKKKKEKRKPQGVEAVPKGQIRRRKLEVFERADLYEGRKGSPKKKGGQGNKEARKKFKHTEITTPKAIKRRIKVPEQVTVADLAKAMGVKAVELVKKLMALGVPTNVNQNIDFETASLVAEEFGYGLELDRLEVENLLTEKEDNPETLKNRPPVVTIMGHVDHGKTSLLDYIRNSNIIAGESGGITQHIGAYYVEKEGGDVVFLDTPGHEAFTAMRARGAKVTDIIVLVVAADDGVMPQTREAANHARAAEIPIIVAINKIDKPEANLDRVQRELSELELIPEDWGGDTIFGKISAKTGEGIDELLDLIQLQAEMLELKANPDRLARGTIIEARLDKSKGPVATVLIKTGTLHQGDFFVCGEHFGKIRAMLNHRGKRMDVAGPSVPVGIYGISGVPMAGDEFMAVEDEKKAKQIIEHRQGRMKTREQSGHGIVSLDDLFEKIKKGDVKELNIIVKADVQGSLEAIGESLIKLSTPEVKLEILHSSTGAITETDVMLASASNAIIIGFNVRANPRVSEVAEKEHVDIRYYDVIYNAIQDIRNAMVGLLDPVFKEKVIGRAEVKETFHVPKIGVVAGCYVTNGHVERSAHARLLREEVVVFDGKLASLRRFKDDVKEVQSGYECGMGLENFQDIKPGDIFEVYEMEEVAAEL